MKHLFYTLFFLFCAATTVTAQTVSQVRSQSTDPTYTPSGAVTAPPLCYNRTTHHLWGYAGGYWYDLTGGTYVDLDPSPTNEKIVSFSVVAGVLRINENGIFYNVPINDIIAAANISSASPTITVTNVAGVVTVTSTDPDESVTNELQNLNLAGQTLSISSGNNVALPVVGVTAGLGIGTSTVAGVTTVTNTSPDQTVTLTGAGINAVTGTYPNFTVTGTEVDGSTTNEVQTITQGYGTIVTQTGIDYTVECDTTQMATQYDLTQLNVVANGLYKSNDTIKLGGALIENTFVVGGMDKTMILAITDTVNTINKVDLSSAGVQLKSEGSPNTSEVTLNVGDLLLRGETAVKIVTPNTPASPNGSVLTLIDNLTGEAEWQPAAAQDTTAWRLTGNAGTDGGTLNFLGTTDAQDLVLKTNSSEIARFGQQGNVAIGSDLTSLDPVLIPPVANNIGSMAFQSGQATGLYSTAFHLATASGGASMAWGVGYNHGISPIASGVSSTAWGGETSAVGSFSTCFGFQNIANGDQSTCFGQENTNNANYATVFGFQNTAEGYLSTIFGSANISDINGANSTIWGTGNQVSNAHGTAWGQDNVASGISSTVFGKSNRSEALYSLASGFNNVASGDNSVVFGAYNNSVSYAEMVLGHFSTFYIPISITTINTADRLLTVGNGANALTTNNALTMWKDGRSMWNGDVAKTNTWIGVNGTNAQNFINVTTPTGALAAISTEHTTSGNYAVLGSNAGNSGLTINNTKQFAFTTTAGTTSTALGATTTVANYNNTGFLFGGGGTAAANLHLAGSEACDYTTIAATTTLLPTNRMVYVNNGATNITITIPAGDKLLYTITRLDNTSTGTITVQLAGGTIQDIGGTIGATTSISAVSGQRSETFHVTGTVARRTTNQ